MWLIIGTRLFRSEIRQVLGSISSLQTNSSCLSHLGSNYRQDLVILVAETTFCAWNHMEATPSAWSSNTTRKDMIFRHWWIIFFPITRLSVKSVRVPRVIALVQGIPATLMGKISSRTFMWFFRRFANFLSRSLLQFEISFLLLQILVKNSMSR